MDCHISSSSSFFSSHAGRHSDTYIMKQNPKPTDRDCAFCHSNYHFRPQMPHDHFKASMHATSNNQPTDRPTDTHTHTTPTSRHVLFLLFITLVLSVILLLVVFCWRAMSWESSVPHNHNHNHIYSYPPPKSDRYIYSWDFWWINNML